MVRAVLNEVPKGELFAVLEDDAPSDRFRTAKRRSDRGEVLQLGPVVRHHDPGVLVRDRRVAQAHRRRALPPEEVPSLGKLDVLEPAHEDVSWRRRHLVRVAVEGVPESMDRPDEGSPPRPRAEDVPQLAHDGRQPPRGRPLGRPQGLEDLLAGDGAGPPLEEERQKLEGLRREMEDRAPPMEEPTASVEGEASESQPRAEVLSGHDTSHPDLHTSNTNLARRRRNGKTRSTESAKSEANERNPALLRGRPARSRSASRSPSSPCGRPGRPSPGGSRRRPPASRDPGRPRLRGACRCGSRGPRSSPQAPRR